MANPDRPKGFTPVRHVNGGSWNNALATLVRVDDETFDEGAWGIGVGTPVRFTAQEDIEDNLEGLPSAVPLEDETANQEVIGVVVGIANVANGTLVKDFGMFDPSNLDGPHHILAADVEGDVDKYALYVAPAKDWVFEVQTTETAEAIGIGDTLAVMALSNATVQVDTSTGLSNLTVGLNSEGGADEVQLRVVGVPARPDNDIELADAAVEVMFVDPWPVAESQ